MKSLVYDGNELKEVEFNCDTYEFTSNTVGGWIEHIPIKSLPVDMWGNDEAKLIGLEPTILLLYNGEPYDYVCGNVCFLTSDSEGNSHGLSDKNIEFIRNKFKKDGYAFVPTLGKILQCLEYEVIK